MRKDKNSNIDQSPWPSSQFFKHLSEKGVDRFCPSDNRQCSADDKQEKYDILSGSKRPGDCCKEGERAQPSCILGDLERTRHHHFPSVNQLRDRKSTRLNSSHVAISYAVFC